MGYRQVSIVDLQNRINNNQIPGIAGTYETKPTENDNILFVIAIGGTALTLTDIETGIAHIFATAESFVHPLRFNKGFVLSGTNATVLNEPVYYSILFIMKS